MTGHRGAEVGTCATDLYGLQCTFDISVSLAYRDALDGIATGSGIRFAVPA